MSNLGISLIIPSHKGRDKLPNCLDSVFAQDINPKLLELIIIVNGKDDGTLELIEQIKAHRHNFNFIIFHTQQASVSNARNIGVALATREYIVFLDDDDKISPSYLSSLYALAAPNTLVLAQLVNVSVNSQPTDDKATINKLPHFIYNFIIKARVLTMNACKLIPRNIIQHFKFDTTLRSSEDMAMFSALLISNKMKIMVVGTHTKAIYFRTISRSSVSRQPISYDFNIYQRLMVIRSIYSNITPKVKLLIPQNLLFFISRIIGELAYSLRIVFIHLQQKIKFSLLGEKRES